VIRGRGTERHHEALRLDRREDDNCVIALIDHQPQMMFGVAGVDRQSIINNTVALAKATRVLALDKVAS